MRAAQRRRWTREEYDRLVEQGVLTEGDQVELIEGEIVPKMPQNAPHAVAVVLVQDALREAFGSDYHVRPSLPLVAGDASELEPDLAVLAGRAREYARLTTHPSSALLIVEIADSSLPLDRRRKARVYARAGFPEYWIINLQERLVEVRRDPLPSPDSPSDARYASLTVYREGDQISPLHAPVARIAVVDLLP